MTDRTDRRGFISNGSEQMKNPNHERARELADREAELRAEGRLQEAWGQSPPYTGHPEHCNGGNCPDHDTVFLTGGPEYERAWGRIGDAFGSKGCVHESTGQTWQYMGSVREGGRWLHSFRHRRLPAGTLTEEVLLSDAATVARGEPFPDGSRRVTVKVPAPDGWSPSQEHVHK